MAAVDRLAVHDRRPRLADYVERRRDKGWNETTPHLQSATMGAMAPHEHIARPGFVVGPGAHALEHA